MKRVPYEEMVAQFARVLEKKGFTASDAQDAAIIFAQNSLAGVFSHGLNRFPRVVSYLEKGEIDPAARATCVSSMGSIERWDGHRGFGPLNATRAMDRACELAKQNGVGVVALGNNNHWMRGGNLMIGMLIIGTLWTVLPLFGNTFATNPDFIAAYPGVTDISFVDAITKVYQSGPEGWGSVLVNVVFGAWFGRVLLETGIADALIRKTVELGGDKPIVISVLLSIVTTAIFSTLFGAGAVVAIGVIILPILMSLGIPKVLAVGSFMMSVGAGMYLNPVLSGQFLAFFLDENGKQLITYDDPARLRWAVIGMLVQLGMVIVMTAVSLRKKKTVHAWVASAARRARPGYVPTKALIAPILPVLLLVIFKVPIILGFTLASLYAMLVCGKMKSFRGVCRTINKDFYDGVVDTAPLVGFLLMIPIFNKSAELCVPYFNALLGGIIPNSTLVISIFFALLAPLGLFRGPFTLFGCGAATLGILKGIGFSTPYLYALMVIPSITMNVSICMTQSWIAWGVSYAKVSTREHLKKTLPYAWITCAVMQVITFVMFG